MRFSPHFQLFYFNKRLEFCEFFEWKIKRINNADLFSQLPLLIFTKGANISGGHCISVCVEWMYTLYKFHFLNGISEINQLFDDILIIWPAPVYIFYYTLLWGFNIYILRLSFNVRLDRK